MKKKHLKIMENYSVPKNFKRLCYRPVLVYNIDIQRYTIIYIIIAEIIRFKKCIHRKVNKSKSFDSSTSIS